MEGRRLPAIAEMNAQNTEGGGGEHSCIPLFGGARQSSVNTLDARRSGGELHARPFLCRFNQPVIAGASGFL